MELFVPAFEGERKNLQDQRCEWQQHALSEPPSMISCLHDFFLGDQLLPTPHLFFLY